MTATMERTTMTDLAGSLETGSINGPLREARSTGAGTHRRALGQPWTIRMDPMRISMADSVRCQQDQFVNGSHVLHSGVRGCS